MVHLKEHCHPIITKRTAKKRFVAYDTIQTLGVLNKKEEDAHSGDYTLCVNDIQFVSVTLTMQVSFL